MTHVHHIGRASAAVGAALAALAAGAAPRAALAAGAASDALARPPATQCAGLPAATTAVAFWSTEARCAIVPPTAGPENFGNKFPGEAAVYMGIAHVAIYDAAVATAGRGEPFGPVEVSAPHGASAAAAIATASYDTLSGLQPVLALASSGQATLAGDYTAYLAGVPDGPAKTAGIATGERVAQAVLAWRANDGLERNPVLADLNPPAPGPGVWQPNPAVPPATIAPPPLGLRLPG